MGGISTGDDRPCRDCRLCLRQQASGDTVVPANGVRGEFEIAKELGLMLIPIGATGYMAQELWKELTDNFGSYYPHHPELKPLFDLLVSETDNKRLIETVVEIISKAKGN
jgi:hypothetical protein